MIVVGFSVLLLLCFVKHLVNPVVKAATEIVYYILMHEQFGTLF